MAIGVMISYEVIYSYFLFHWANSVVIALESFCLRYIFKTKILSEYMQCLQ